MAQTIDKKYLDLTGTQHLKEKLEEELVAKVEGTQAHNLGAYKVKINSDGLVTETANLSYNDLSDKPTIGDGTLTIQANGKSKGTFTANQTGNSTVDITAEDLGITGVLKFIGAATQTAPTAGQYVRADVTYLETPYTLYIPKTDSGDLEEIPAEVGNVFIITDYAWEVLCTKGGMHGVSEWASLGDESEFARKTTKIEAGEGISIPVGGTLADDTTIAHAVPTGAQAISTLSAVKVQTDKFGHIIGTSAIELNNAGGHSHTVSGSGSADIPTATPTKSKLKLTTGSTSVVTGIEPNKSKLQTTQISGVSGSTTASKATAGTAVVYGTADVGTAVVYGTADVGSSVTYGTANVASSATTVGNANVGTEVVYGKADVGTAVVAGTADVGTQISIIPAKANGTASKATAGTAKVYGTADAASTETTVGNANVGTAVKYGTANVGTTGTVNVNVTTVSSPVASTKYAYDAEYDSTNEKLVLTPLSLATASITQATEAPSTQTLTPAASSTTKIRGAVAASASQTFTPYTFTDVNVATVDTAVEFKPAVAATRTITPAVAAPSTQKIAPAIASTETIYGAVASTLTLTPAKAADTTRKITPAVAASTSRTLTPYTFADVTVPTAATAITVATGSISSDGTGADVVIGLNTPATTSVLNSASIAKNASSGIDFVEDVTTTTSQQSITITGTATTAGEHTHTIK